jgi:hypothetical protein
VSAPSIVHEHPERDPDRQAAHSGHADEQHAEHCDHHGRAREEHRAASGVEGQYDRALGIAPVTQRLAVPRDDQQCVVDADADADHGDGLVGEVGHRDTVGRKLREGDARADAEQRGQDGKARRQQRAERDDQDGDGEEQRDRLAGRHLFGEEEIAPVGDLQTFDVDVTTGSLDLVGGVTELGVGAIGEVHLRVRDPRVLGDLPRARGAVRAHHLHVGHGLLDLGEEPLHRAANGGVADPLLGAGEGRRARAPHRRGSTGEGPARTCPPMPRSEPVDLPAVPAGAASSPHRHVRDLLTEPSSRSRSRHHHVAIGTSRTMSRFG